MSGVDFCLECGDLSGGERLANDGTPPRSSLFIAGVYQPDFRRGIGCDALCDSRVYSHARGYFGSPVILGYTPAARRDRFCHGGTGCDEVEPQSVGQWRAVFVHRLVLEQTLGPLPGVCYEPEPHRRAPLGEADGGRFARRSGGVCELGPRPDGACCRPIAPCSPRPSLRWQRGRFTLAVLLPGRMRM